MTVPVSALVVGLALVVAGAGDAVIGAARPPTGEGQLIAFEPFAEQGDICLFPGATPAFADVRRGPFPPPPRLRRDLAIARPRRATAGRSAAVQSAPGGPQENRPIHLDRPAARVIKDPWAGWSAIAVNPENNMVVVTDENLHRIVEFNRLDRTPANVEATTPRRVIEGVNTETEMLTGVYIDPKTLDVYVTNNDTVNFMPVFSREAQGNTKPDRLLATPHRSWGIAVDEIRQELYMTIQSPSAVVVYTKTAAGTEAPLRTLEGDATELNDPRGIAVDSVNNVLVISTHGHKRFYGGGAVSTLRGTWEQFIERTGFPAQVNLRQLPRRYLPGLGQIGEPSINIYALNAGGNTAPLRVIKGPRTQLNWPSHVAVHEQRGEIFVANDADNSILVFKLTDNGNVAPTRVISGPRSLVSAPTGLALDRVNSELWVANMGNYAVTVYPVTANGDAPPVRTIRGGPTGRVGLMIGNPGAIAYDSKRQELLVPN